MKNGVFWDVTPCGSCKNRRFGGTQRLHHQLRSVHRLPFTANVPSLLILATLMMETLRSSKRRFLQVPHSVTSQKTQFLNINVVPSSLIISNVMTEAIGPPKRWFIQEKHGVTSQKTEFVLE
jgi:hypothetical protein